MKRDPQKMRLWQERIQLQQDSGLSVHAWCDKNEINRNTFFYWKNRLNGQQETDICFAEIPLKQIQNKIEETDTMFDSHIHVKYKDYEVLIGSQASAPMITTVLQALRHSC